MKSTSSVVLILALALAACGPRVLRDAEQRLESGWAEMEDQSFEAARGTFTEILDSDSLDRSIEAQALYGFAVASSQSGDPEAAIEGYDRLVRDFPDQTDLVPHALLNSAGDYERLGRFGEEEATLLRMLETGAEDSAPSGDTRLMGNPYANQRHRAAFALAEFYARRERYVLAEAYVAAARHAFPYQHFCGNALRSDTYTLVLLESTILEHLGQDDQAEAILLPYVFNRGFNPCLEEQVAVRGATLLREKFAPDELEALVQESLDSIQSTGDPDDSSWTIRLAGHDVSFYPYALPGDYSESRLSVDEVRQRMLRTTFFRTLAGNDRAVSPAVDTDAECWTPPGSSG